MATHMDYPLVDDDYRVDPNLDHGFGYAGRDLLSYPIHGSGLAASGFQRLDTNEILDRIREKDAANDWVTDRCDKHGLKVKNQKNSSYCWIHAPTHGMEICYVLQGGHLLVLSAFFAGANIKNGHDQGGSGVVGVKYLQTTGTCLETMHGVMDFNTDHDAAHIANARLHRINQDAEEFDPSDNQLIYSAVVQDQPVTVGIPSMSHEVVLTRLTVVNGIIVPIFDNSWNYTWGNNGRGILQGRNTHFDEAMAIRSVTPAMA